MPVINTWVWTCVTKVANGWNHVILDFGESSYSFWLTPPVRKGFCNGGTALLCWAVLQRGVSLLPVPLLWRAAWRPEHPVVKCCEGFEIIILVLCCETLMLWNNQIILEMLWNVRMINVLWKLQKRGLPKMIQSQENYGVVEHSVRRC